MASPFDDLREELKKRGKAWPLSPGVFDTLSTEHRDILSHGFDFYKRLCSRDPENIGLNHDSHFRKNCVTYAKLAHLLSDKGIPWDLYAQFLVDTSDLRIVGWFGSASRIKEFLKWVKSHTDKVVRTSDKLKVLGMVVGNSSSAEEVMSKVLHGHSLRGYADPISDQDQFSGTYLAWRLNPDYSELDTEALQKVRQSCENLRSESFRSQLYRLAKERGFEDFCNYLENWTFPESLSSGEAGEQGP